MFDFFRNDSNDKKLFKFSKFSPIILYSNNCNISFFQHPLLNYVNYLSGFNFKRTLISEDNQTHIEYYFFDRKNRIKMYIDVGYPDNQEICVSREIYRYNKEEKLDSIERSCFWDYKKEYLYITDILDENRYNEYKEFNNIQYLSYQNNKLVKSLFDYNFEPVLVEENYYKYDEEGRLDSLSGSCIGLNDRNSKYSISFKYNEENLIQVNIIDNHGSVDNNTIIDYNFDNGLLVSFKKKSNILNKLNLKPYKDKEITIQSMSYDSLKRVKKLKEESKSSRFGKYDSTNIIYKYEVIDINPLIP